MKGIPSALALVAYFAATTLLAADLELADGRVLADARVIDSDPISLIVAHAGGVENVPLESCTLELQAIYGYDPKAAGELKAEREKALAEQEAQLAARAAERESQLEARLGLAGALDAAAPVSAPKLPTQERVEILQPFGIQIGDRAVLRAVPYKVESGVQYYVAPKVPSPIPELGEYSLLVSEGNGRVVGVEAAGKRENETLYFRAISSISAELNEVFGKPNYYRGKWEDGRDEERWVWRSGPLAITLYGEHRRKITLQYRLPQ